MIMTTFATFDGTVLRLDGPLELAPNTRVRITIEPEENPPVATRSFFKTASALQIEGPTDWSEHLEEYLYGKDKAQS